MGSHPEPGRRGVRPGRTRSARAAGRGRRPAEASRTGVVAVTNAASPAGEVLLALLRDDPDVDEVVAVDTRRGRTSGVTWRLADPADPGVVEHLRGADAVVHLAPGDDIDAALRLGPRRRAWVLRSAQAVTTAAAAAGARHLVVVTSAMVYGAAPDAPVPVPEGADLVATPDAGVVGDVLEVEAVAARARTSHPGLLVTSVRPAALVGPGVDTVITRHFEAPRLLVLRDDRMAWQFCHVEDLASAVLTVLRERLAGPLTVGSPGAMNTRTVEQLSGMRRIELPAALAFATAERLHRVGVLPMPAEDLAYVVHPWVVGSAALRAAGWSARYDNETCLGVLLAEVRGRRALGARRVERKDAAVGAAGAAVAIVGTAAVWRQARSRRRGS